MKEQKLFFSGTTINNTFYKQLTSKAIMIFLISSLFAFNASAQGQKISIVQKGKPLNEILNEIELKSGYSILVRSNDVDLKQIVTLNISNKTVEEILTVLFKSNGIKFEVNGKNISIFAPQNRIDKKNSEQTVKKITGLVTDEKGEPIIGATIIEVNTKKGTISDINGIFLLETYNSGKIRISYIGYESREIVISEKNSIKISLTIDSKNLEEVVVVGYGVQKKNSIIGSISNLNSKDLVRTFSPTISGALVGKLPGISARSINGRPGSSTDIQIRNLGTPLFVIDGVTSSEGNFNNLDPNDIESISVLKDASAAIYGIQAANGVVLISTKSGKRNTKSQINGRFYSGISNPQFTPTLADAPTFYRGKMEEELNGMTIDILKTGSTSKTQSYTMDHLNAYQNGSLPSTDWYKFIVQNNARVNYGNLSASGGSESIGYYFSLSHIGQEGMFKEFDYMRTNMQANIDANIAQGLKVGIKMNGRIETRSNPSVAGVDDYWVPIFTLYQTLPTHMPYANNNPNYRAPTNLGWANPTTFNKDVSGKLDDEWVAINPQFFIEYKLPWIKGLTWQGTYSIQKSFNTRDNFDYTYYT